MQSQKHVLRRRERRSSNPIQTRVGFMPPFLFHTPIHTFDHEFDAHSIIHMIFVLVTSIETIRQLKMLFTECRMLISFRFLNWI